MLEYWTRQKLGHVERHPTELAPWQFQWSRTDLEARLHPFPPVEWEIRKCRRVEEASLSLEWELEKIQIEILIKP